MEEVFIETEYIKLDSAMKLSGSAESGAFAKAVISEGQVKVNGELETRRGRKLYPKDIFSFEGQCFVIKGAPR